MSDSNKVKKEKKTLKSLVKKTFTRLFGFEANIDLTKDSLVLKRKNIVIKNIIFLLNIFFFVLMTVYSTLSWLSTSWGESGSLLRVNKIINWVVMIATFPTTFLINFFLKKIINKSETDPKIMLHNQQIAMYFSVVYLFIAPLLFYLKINLLWEQNSFNDLYKHTFETFSYLTFYLSLLICSFYNDKKLMINSTLIMFALITIIHFFVTHNFIYVFTQNDKSIRLVPVIDIVLRYMVFINYCVVLIAITSRNSFLHQKRKEELMRRENVEGDFYKISANIVSYLRDVSYINNDAKLANNVLVIANYLASLVGLDIKEKEELNSFGLVGTRLEDCITEFNTISKDLQLNILQDYERLKELTFLASEVMRRVQLSIKVEEITRQYQEIVNHQIFNTINFLSLIDQIIFLAELYYMLRTPQEYKEPLRHIDSLNFILTNFTGKIDNSLKEIFLSFNEDINNLFLDL